MNTASCSERDFFMDTVSCTERDFVIGTVSLPKYSLLWIQLPLRKEAVL